MPIHPSFPFTITQLNPGIGAEFQRGWASDSTFPPPIPTAGPLSSAPETRIHKGIPPHSRDTTTSSLLTRRQGPHPHRLRDLRLLRSCRITPAAAAPRSTGPASTPPRSGASSATRWSRLSPRWGRASSPWDGEVVAGDRSCVGCARRQGSPPRRAPLGSIRANFYPLVRNP